MIGARPGGNGFAGNAAAVPRRPAASTDEPAVQRCDVVDAPPGWPALHVLAVAHPVVAEQCDAAARAAARRRVRELLLRHAGPEIATPFLATARSERGAHRVSISHEPSLSLLAWCEHGCIGIDIVDRRRLAPADPQELADTARLYLGPSSPASASHRSDAPGARVRFAEAWSRHEAKLKCLGLELGEWVPALEARLSSCQSAVVQLPPADHAGASPWVARVAWQPPLPA